EDFNNLLKQAGEKLVVRLSEEQDNSNVVFLAVDVDEADDVASHCKIKSTPTVHFYKNGKKIDEFSGSNRETLDNKVKALR
ncbi:unnamed protein product, partial [Menidia menidia]